MGSYSLGTEYGTDQININSPVFSDFLRRDEYNDFHQINKIKDREIRLYEKIKAYNNINNNKECFNYQTIPSTAYSKNIPDKKILHSAESMAQDSCRGYYVNQAPNNTDTLKTEIENLEKKNNTLIVLLCILLVVILTQYSKSGGITYMYPHYQTATIHPAAIPAAVPGSVPTITAPYPVY